MTHSLNDIKSIHKSQYVVFHKQHRGKQTRAEEYYSFTGLNISIYFEVDIAVT